MVISGRAIKGAGYCHTLFRTSNNDKKYRVSIGECNIAMWCLGAALDIFVRAIFIVYLTFVGQKFDITKKMTFLWQFV